MARWLLPTLTLALVACASASPAVGGLRAGDGRSPTSPVVADEQAAAPARHPTGGTADPQRAGGVVSGPVSAGRSGSPFLATLPVQASEAASELARAALNDRALASGLSVVIETGLASAEFREMAARGAISQGPSSVVVPALGRYASRDVPGPGDRAASFVVDYDQPVFEQLDAAMVAFRQGAPVGVDSTVRFVSQHIADKTYARDFDFASRVAQTQSGDCTEHAVLTAALLRRQGMSARVVFGVVLLAAVAPDRAVRWTAWGHAWTEHHDGQSWQVADAALTTANAEAASLAAGSVVLRRVYVPTRVMRNETMGYLRGMLTGGGVHHIRGVQVGAQSP